MDIAQFERLPDFAKQITDYIFEAEAVDTEHIYLDGTKLKANVNNYSWVWKKSCITNRNRVFEKLNYLLSELNDRMALLVKTKFEAHQEYEIEYVECILTTFAQACQLNESQFVHGKGKCKSQNQRLYEKLKEYLKQLKKYAGQK